MSATRLVINVQLAHLGLHALARFLLQLLRLGLLKVRLPHLADARGLDELGQLERRLLQATLAL